jgi:hypothetical protein
MDAKRLERIFVPERDPMAGAKRVVAERGLVGCTYKSCRGWVASRCGTALGPCVIVVVPNGGEIHVISDR